MDLRNRRGFGALVVLLAVLLGAVALPMLTLGASNQITGIVSDCVSSSVIPGAQVTLADANGYYPAQKATTGGDGVYAFSPGSGSYTLMANRSGYFAKGAPSPIRFDGQSTVRQDICLDPTPPLNKVAQLTVVNDVTSAVISGAVVDAYYAAASQVVASDANGYKDYATTVTTIAGTLTRDATLAVSDPEKFSTTIVYGSNDWSNLTIYRNTTLNPDSNLTTLNPLGIRDLRLQVDYSLGNGNGVIDGTEAATFHNWLVANGPFYVTTDGNFTTNGKSYLSSAASYTVNVAGLTTPGSKVWINTSATYALKQAPPYVALGAKTYSVNLTLLADKNISVLQDYVYTIAFPRAYELNTSSVVPSAPVEIEAFAPAVINPGVTNLTPQIRMSVTQSLTGTARARVVAPAGKFFVQNATDSNYQAFVAANASLTFSAETTTDP